MSRKGRVGCDRRGGREGGDVDLGCWEEAVTWLVGPVEGDGCGEGDEEVLERNKWLLGDNLITQSGPVR